MGRRERRERLNKTVPSSVPIKYGTINCSLGAFRGHGGWVMVLKIKIHTIANLSIFFHVFISPFDIFYALLKYCACLNKTMDFCIKSIIKNSFKQFKNLKKIWMKLELKLNHMTLVSVKNMCSSLAVVSYALQHKIICPIGSYMWLSTVLVKMKLPP